jgi:hypothetical protein
MLCSTGEVLCRGFQGDQIGRIIAVWMIRTMALFDAIFGYCVLNLTKGGLGCILGDFQRPLGVFHKKVPLMVSKRANFAARITATMAARRQLATVANVTLSATALDQGDQIGRIFANWVFVYFGQYFLNYIGSLLGLLFPW